MQKFCLRNYAGTPTTYFQVNKQQVPVPDGSTGAPSLSHHILVVDRSGSMYYEIENLKNTLLKLLTLEEFSNAQLLVSLISYSSRGDLSLHFDRTPVQDVMAAGSPQQKEIKKIRVTGLTCISQAMIMAMDLINEDELTAISLHSDGYANDSSPSSEKRALEVLCADLSKKGDVFINTIAYSSYSDFQLLNMVANIGAGACVRANNIRQVYDALNATTQVLTSNVTPTLVEPIREDTYQVFVSVSGRKLCGSSGDLKVCGVKAEDDKVIYRYREIDKATYEALSCPVAGEGGSWAPLYAFARAQLSEGNLNAAKYALVSTRNDTLISAHSRALTTPEIASFAAGLDEALFDVRAYTFTDSYGLDMSQITVLGVVALLDGLARDGQLSVDLKDLRDNYTRRGLRRVDGTRDDKGNLIPFGFKSESIDGGQFAPVKRFEINQNSANINMLVSRPARLVNAVTGDPVEDIAGVSLKDKLQLHNNYTVVGNGEVTLTSLLVQIESKKGFRALASAGLVTGDFDPAKAYRITFTGRPLVGFDQQYGGLNGVFECVAGMRVLNGILNACLRQESENYTPEQVQALKDHGLSAGLNFNFPTTNEYTDLQDALSKGEVDSRLSYKIDIGSTAFLNASKLKSANEFLQRLFTMEVNGEPSKKPVFADFWESTGFGFKALSARTKLTKADEFQRRVFEDFLGLGSEGAVQEVLQSIGMADKTEALLGVVKDRSDKDGAVELMTEVRRALDGAIARIYREDVSPLAFYVGATGLVPDDLGAQMYTGEDLKEKYPDLVLAKAELEGTFFVVGDCVISVYTESSYFSV